MNKGSRKALSNKRTRARKPKGARARASVPVRILPHYSGLKRLTPKIAGRLLARVELLLRSSIFTRTGCSEVSVSFVRDSAIRRLNREYRGKDKATDVLSFAQDGELGSHPLSPSLGDLVISTDTAARQAHEFGVALLDELTRLVTHGMLHLVGYDHEGVSRRRAQRMFRTQSALLGRLRRQ